MSDDRKRLLAACDVFQHGHGPKPLHVRLRELADWCEANDADVDSYGTGTTVQAFENRVAELLGKEAAVFMPSGTMAQQIALRIWADRSGRRHVGMHSTSHLDRDEQRGYAVLHGLHATLLGLDAGVIGAGDVERCGQPLSAVVLELPARRIGGQMPDLEGIRALAAACHERGTRLHMDGARLWEAIDGLGCSHAEVCGHFDSVYVSVYKGVGAMAGAVLAGPADFIAEARIWQRRHGGNLPTMAPFVAGAAMRFERRIARMPSYAARAREVVDAVRHLPNLRFVPDPPQANLVHAHFAAPTNLVSEARDAVCASHQVVLFGGIRPTDLGCAVEIYFGEGATDAPLERLVDAWRAFADALEVRLTS